MAMAGELEGGVDMVIIKYISSIRWNERGSSYRLYR